MSRIPLGPLSGNNLGDYLREQRQSARLSLRQLSELAGVSNPYLSQIERGLKKPSAEILQQLAKGLEVSAESLYVRAGILDERHGDAPATHAAVHGAALDTRAVIGADPQLTERQKAALLDIYDSFVGAGTAKGRPRSSSTTKTGAAKSGAAKSSTTKTSTAKSRTKTPPTEGA
ncbi:transcriptional regulator with XRE-family HTH domain [Phycicoccus badiiscoriae]|uniref:Transcriptional regulator with XRE-family HTH domain n=1 Tax=Pedococcus badiiscoriae TaxID=642776 RepID=A0A852WCZ4_9MICO|nr:helix-turn-helix transcriptional regulator [Pedococcus badiiscoriae]NYG07147.1 transcriptional regulator with XRE-family HTH domain [Pedococcus badiiscoriae]